jgi:hypothetical protein
VQKEILEKNPTANVHVYAIWFSMLPTDGRSMWRWGGSTLTDSRVAHFWDQQKLVGRWFAEHENPGEANGIVWDAYYLFGPDAQWDFEPKPLTSSGGTVREKYDELNQKLVPLLDPK